jgi:hypothetical protein
LFLTRREIPEQALKPIYIEKMMYQVKCPKRALTVFFALLSVCLSAQQVHTVKVEGSGSRTPLVVTKGISTIQLEGLEPGRFYLVEAVPAGEAQKSELSLSPVFSEVANNSGSKNEGRAMRFKAPGTTAGFLLNAGSEEVSPDMPVFISVSAESGPWSSKESKSLQESAVALQVTPGVSPQSLIANTLVGGDCFSVSNITASGNTMSRGYFLQRSFQYWYRLRDGNEYRQRKYSCRTKQQQFHQRRFQRAGF